MLRIINNQGNEIKATVRYCLTLIWMATVNQTKPKRKNQPTKQKNLEKTRADKGLEKPKHWCTVDLNVKRYSHRRKQ